MALQKALPSRLNRGPAHFHRWGSSSSKKKEVAEEIGRTFEPLASDWRWGWWGWLWGLAQ